MANLTTIHEFDLGKGIDARSSENQIPEGHCEEAVNANFTETRVEKRKGYEQNGGYIPLRAESIQVLNNAGFERICIDFDSSIDVTRLVPHPVKLRGTTDIAWDSIAANVLGEEWYSTFEVVLRQIGTTTIAPASHGFNAASMLVGATESTNQTDLSNSVLMVDTVSISKNFGSNTLDQGTTFSPAADPGPSTTPYIPYFLNTTPTAPDFAGFEFGNVGSGTQTLTIGTGLTGINGVSLSDLRNFNYIVQVYEMNTATFSAATQLDVILPDNVRILADGSIEIDLIPTGTSNYYISVHTPVAANSVAGTAEAVTAPGGGVTTVTLSSDNAFIFTGIYTFNTSLNQREIIIPDLIIYDDTTRQYTITFTNTAASSVGFEIYYAFGSLQVNEVCVDTTVAAAGSDGDLLRQTSNLEMDVYGIDHDLIFSGNDRGGWASHIDTYRTGAINELVIGSGGVFYRQQQQNYSNLLPRTIITATESRTFGPAFQGSGSNVNRTRGALRFDGGDTGFGEVESVTYISGSTVEYVINIPNSDLNGAVITDIFEVGKDDFTVSQMGYSVHNGTFPITSITYNENIPDKTLDTLTIQVTNPAVAEDAFNEVDAGGEGGIFTDVFDLPGFAGTIELFPGDFLEGGTIPVDTITVKVVDNTNKEVVLSGITEEVSISDGVSAFGERTSALIPVVSGLTDTFVPGDMLSYSGHNRLNRIKFIRTAANTSCSISGTTVTVATTEGLNTGEAVGIITDNTDSGIYTIDDVTGATTFTISTSLTSTSGTLLGNTINLDEALEYRGTIEQSTALSSTAQWQAIEHPTRLAASDRLTGELVERYLDVNPYENQPFVRSASVNNNLYFTNGDDEVLKYDGDNIYQAGLYRWEGGMYATPVNVGTGTIPAGNYSYYIRLNYLDRSGNIVGSASHGNEGDFLVELASPSDVSLKVALPPVYGNLDYDNLQVEIYRTKAGGSLFFFLNSLAVSYASGQEYVTYTDIDLDVDLVESDPLEITGGEPPNQLDSPLRAKYVTSANNRLILGNLRDYPSIDLQVRRRSLVNLATFDGLGVSVSDGTRTQVYRFTSVGGTSISAVGSSTFTVTSTAGLSIGGIAYVYQRSASNAADYLGYFKISNIVGNVITVEQSFSTVAPTDLFMIGILGEVPVFTSNTIPDFNYVDNLRNPAGVTGFGIRLSKAVNAVSAIDASLVIASGDLNFSKGQVILRRMIADTTAVTVTIDDSLSTIFTGANPDATLFVSGIRATFSGTSSTNGLTTVAFPSRLLVSARSNFPELFNNIRAISDVESDSVIDVNSADGQEITGVIPFFGESTSQDSRKQDIVIVFKTNSIYAVDIGLGTINKIDSRGIGCTAPFSIANVPNGIIFANESGIYRLNRSYDVIWVGRMIDRKWKSEVNQDQLGLVQGHIYPEEQQYKLSYPKDGETTPSEVLVYDYGDEGEGQSGNWSQYNNHPATGWCNLLSQAFLGTTRGRIFSVRKRGDVTDFRDDDQAISFSFTHRALHFGDPGRRKILRRIISNFRVLTDSTNSALAVATDLDEDFRSTSSFIIDASAPSDNLSDSIGDKVLTIRHSLPIQRGVYFQLKYTNGGIDEPIEIAGISFVLTGLTDAGITEAGDT